MAEITKELGRIPVSRGNYQATTEYYKDNIVQYKRGSYQVVSESPIIGVPPTNDKNIVNPGWTLFAGTLDAQDVVNQIKEQEAQSIQAVAAREAEILAKSDASKISSSVIGLEGSNVEDKLTNASNKLSELETKVIYDVSAHNDGAVFESLSALLSSSNLDTLIPTLVRRGGMSIKFIQSSDNKYVQYRLMNNQWSTKVTDWQGVDDKPTTESNNLVKSGGVDAAIKDTLPKDIEEDGLYICDKNGNVVIRLDILDTKGGFGENLTAAINTLIEEAGSSSIIKEVIEDGLYICNESGEAVAKFINDKWQFLGLDATVTYQSGVATKRGDMSNGTEWVISNNSVKHDKILLFSGKISSFNSLTLGHGKISNGEANWIEITATNIIEHFVNSGGAEYTGYPKTTPHGLTIENNIQVEIVQAEQANANVTIVSSGHSFKLGNIVWFGSSGDVYAISTSTLTDCSLGWTCSKIKSGIWLFGDSYFSLSDSARWTSYLFSNGYNNFMLNAHPGESSTAALNNLNKLLEIDTPKEIVWCMGMNDPDSDSAVNSTWKSKLDDVIAICEEKEIKLILATIPTVAGGYNQDTQSHNVGIHKYKNAIVRESGYRYIDFDSAVGANETTGEWFNNGQGNDMLEGYGQQRGRIHPTTYGALALYHQAIADCPELTR